MEIIKTKKGALSILAGKTDMGKSTISVYNCADQIRSGENVLFFSYEYCQSIIYNKLVGHFGLKWQELFNVNVVDSRDWTIKDVITEIKRRKDVIDFVYVDYLDLLRDATFKEAKDGIDSMRLSNLQYLIMELSSLAKELNIGIIVLTQVKENATLETTIENLNLVSSTIKPDTEVIKMFIGRDEALNSKIKCTDISHVILVDGYNLNHFSSINLKEAYKY